MNINPNLIDTLKKSIKEEKEVRTSEFIIAIIINIIFFYIFNNLLNWHINFITNSFQDVLWIINLTLGFTIIVNDLYLFYHPKWLRDSLQIIINILGFLVVYFLYTVYPFNFSQIFISYGLKISFNTYHDSYNSSYCLSDNATNFKNIYKNSEIKFQD